MDQFGFDSKRLLLLSLINSFPGIIANNPKSPSCTYEPMPHIDTGDHKPIFIPPRQYSPATNEALNQSIDEMLHNGIIIPWKNARWGFPAQVIKKKDGSTRIVIDYRKINAITVPINYSFTRIDESLSALRR